MTTTITEYGGYIPPKRTASKSAARVFPQPLFVSPISHTGSEDRQPATNLYFSELWPLFYLLKLLGVFPYYVSSSGKLAFKLMSMTTLYATASTTVTTVGSILTIIQKYSKLSAEKMKFEDAIVQINLFGGFFFIAILPFVYYTETRKRIQFINRWGIFQEEFRRVTGKTVDLGLGRRARFFVVMSLHFSVFGVISLGVLVGGFSWWQYCISGLFETMLLLMPAVWYLTCRGLIRAAKALGNEVEQNLLHHGFRHTDALVQFKFLWLHLSKLTQDAGRSMGFTYGVFTLFCFGGLVVSSYGYFVSGIILITQGLAFTAFFFSTILYVQCTFAQLATEEVGSKFQDRVQIILEKYPLISGTQEEIHRFLAMICSNPPVINFCGFVDINRGLITSLMSQTLTYLIVMTQINKN
ncbi:gustatory and odorant receptor 24-like [Zootermopsis nevadensis]|nr:gustatory and odorant receptor 24-like [Zootermopsis nevadensis]